MWLVLLPIIIVWIPLSIMIVLGLTQHVVAIARAIAAETRHYVDARRR